MNINTSQIAPKPINQSQSKPITITVPEVKMDVDDIYEKGWNVLDNVASGVAKLPSAMMSGVMSAVPGFGLYMAHDIKNSENMSTKSNFTKMANLSSAASQVAGLGALGLSALSGMTGIGPAQGLLITSGGLFGLAGIAGAAADFEIGFLAF